MPDEMNALSMRFATMVYLRTDVLQDFIWHLMQRVVLYPPDIISCILEPGCQ